MERISVLIVDDHVVVRVGMEYVLSGSATIQVAGHASSGTDAIEKVRTLRPAVVLMDVAMPDMDGFEATRRIKEQFPHTRVVIMTVYDDGQHLADAMRAGVDGYLLKTAAPEEISQAVESAARGEIAIKSALFHRAMGKLQEMPGDKLRGPTGGTPVPGSPDRLTARETVVLDFLARGLTNKEIAARLTIAPGTAKRHVESILGKLGANDRTDAAALAVRLGLVK